MNNEQMKWYELRAVDTWFFRDGRPSNRGEDQSDLQSLFPPPHSTVVGAFRAGIARENGWNGRDDWPDEIKAVLGDGFDDLGQLSFDGPYLAHQGNLLFPAPSHLLGTIERDTITRKISFHPTAWLQPSSDRMSTDTGEVHMPVIQSTSKDYLSGESKLKPPTNFFLTVDGMNQVLDGKLPSSEYFFHRDRLYSYESRVGIRRDPENRTTGENAMYHPTFIRMHDDVSVVIGIAGIESPWTPPSLLPLGGESRLATVVEIAAPNMPEPVEGDLLFLATPATFSGECWHGAGPDDPASALHETIQGTVQAAVVDRPRHIGGFDSRTGGGPLPLKPFSPAGSVWWFNQTHSRTNGDAQPLKLGTRTAYGYGRAFIGKRISV